MKNKTKYYIEFEKILWKDIFADVLIILSWSLIAIGVFFAPNVGLKAIGIFMLWGAPLYATYSVSEFEYKKKVQIPIREQNLKRQGSDD